MSWPANGYEIHADRIGKVSRQIDGRLAELLADPDGRPHPIRAAMRYGVLAPGKRLRPLLLLLSVQALGANPEPMLDVACALEMVHAASLFLDDMPCMDDAEMRRGQPTVHLAFGQDVAVLSAVALLAHASRTIAHAAGLPPEVRNHMVVALSDAVGLPGLVSGQYRDLREHDSALSTSLATRTNDEKTGALFAVAFELAVLAAGSTKQVQDVMSKAAAELGQAFQLADDLADAQTDSEAPNGQATLVALVGQAEARAMVANHVARARQLLGAAMPSDTAVLALIHRFFTVP